MIENKGPYRVSDAERKNIIELADSYESMTTAGKDAIRFFCYHVWTERERNVLAELLAAKIGCPREHNLNPHWCDHGRDKGYGVCFYANIQHDCWNRWAWEEVK